MMQMKTVADAMQNSILSAISRDATIPSPLSRLPLSLQTKVWG